MVINMKMDITTKFMDPLQFIAFKHNLLNCKYK